MSSRYVRRLAETWVQAQATAQGVPFYGTINEENNPADPMWVTLEYITFGATKETYCDEFLEDGEIRLVFFGPPGGGDDALLQAAETFAAAVYNNTDPAGRLVLDSIDPPDEYGPQDEPWFIVEIPITYSYRR